ncbi:alanine--tRNA ligase [Mycoplasmoides pirum]|uniref:alanine--tRNA ligase n=1 Tax=Mycoplasmoides pirum TaxID=2122 RepID=UPI000485F5FC|nr:alanine--tRNA ligase [Mycoplasmoides pirum]
MKKLSGNEIRQKWLDFFKSKNHYIVESKSLVPVNDNSLLWINAGIATLKNYFSGKSNPPAPRLTNSQRCLRTNDIENVGVTSRHQTLFEMLGNFSIGDYFKEDAIKFAYELLINEYEIDKNKLYITIYENDDDAYKYWVNVGIDPTHIIRCNRDRNFWDLKQGPCGPCTEIYYDRGIKYDPENIGIKLFDEDIENDRYIEIWNIVFSQFNNDGNDNYSELARKNIDTGSGLERLASIIQDVPTNFDTDLFLPIIREIEKFTTEKYNVEDYFSNDVNSKKKQTYFRVIADHIKAVVFAVSDGVIPGPKGRNYTIRKLIRRIVLYTKKLNIKDNWAEPVIKSVIDLYKDFFKELNDKQDEIKTTLLSEINSYSKTIDKAFVLFKNQISENTLNTENFFKLVETYGLPIEFAKEFLDDAKIKAENSLNLKINNVNVDWDKFDELFKNHQLISKNNNQVAAIEKQNENLLKCNVLSKFDYELNYIKAKVVALFDDEFKPQNKIKNGNGYVIFDKTVIYATSGGQQHDDGYAKKAFKKVHFDNIIKAPNLQHLHHFKNASFKLNEKWILWHDELWRKQSRKNHSLEHILHSTLKKVISESIKQEGAFKNAQKATLDFTHPSKLTDDQLELIEKEIRKVIAAKIPVEIIYTDLEGSKKLNAIAYFDDEYKKHDKLRVIKISDYSVELCGGTHVNNTYEIENCFITNIISNGVGSWRIEIISSHQTIENYLKKQIQKMHNEIESIKIESIKINNQNLINKINSFVLPKNIEELRKKNNEFNELINDYRKIKIEYDKQNQENEANEIKLNLIQNINDNISILETNDIDSKKISIALSNASNEYQNILFLILNKTNNKTQYFASIKKPINEILVANNIIKLLNQKYDGKGGGKKEYAQGGCLKTLSINDIKELLKI